MENVIVRLTDDCLVPDKYRDGLKTIKGNLMSIYEGGIIRIDVSVIQESGKGKAYRDYEAIFIPVRHIEYMETS